MTLDGLLMQAIITFPDATFEIDCYTISLLEGTTNMPPRPVLLYRSSVIRIVASAVLQSTALAAKPLELHRLYGR